MSKSSYAASPSFRQVAVANVNVSLTLIIIFLDLVENTLSKFISETIGLATYACV